MINTSIMLALWLNAFVSYYARNYASIIRQGLMLSENVVLQVEIENSKNATEPRLSRNQHVLQLFNYSYCFLASWRV